MRVLGVDPGLTRCGVGVVDHVPGRSPSLVFAGVIRTPADQPTGARLIEIERELTTAVETHRPDVVAVERVFAQHNLQSVIGTAQVMGLVLLIGTRAGLRVAEHTPSEVKAAITGSGRADKAQVQAMVARVLKLASAPKPADAADAVALAITHCWRGQATNRLAAAVAAAERRQEKR